MVDSVKSPMQDQQLAGVQKPSKAFMKDNPIADLAKATFAQFSLRSLNTLAGATVLSTVISTIGVGFTTESVPKTLVTFVVGVVAVLVFRRAGI